MPTRPHASCLHMPLANTALTLNPKPTCLLSAQVSAKLIQISMLWSNTAPPSSTTTSVNSEKLRISPPSVAAHHLYL
jgi:hypothetical protein